MSLVPRWPGLRFQKKVEIIIPVIIPILILWHLLLPGYVLTLDMIWGPAIFPLSWVVQKGILILIPLTSYLGMHFLFVSTAGNNKIGALFASILYTVNPFTYARFLAGHYLLLLGYSVLPILVLALVRFLRNPTRRRSLDVTLIMALSLLVNLHIFFIESLLVIVVLVVYAFQHANHLGRILKSSIPIIPLLLLLNMFWILPETFQGGESTQLINNIDYLDLQAFTSRTWGAGPNVLFSVASMHGFWLPFNYVSNYLPFWQVFFIVILLVGVFGFVSKSRSAEEKVLKRSMIILALISASLATGISSPFFATTFQFLFDNLLFFRGFREPQKFVSLLVLAYSYLGGIGIIEISKKINRESILQRRNIIPSILLSAALIAPIAYGSNMFFGFGGELRSIDYPEDWYEANNEISLDNGENKILFLPWHLYMPYSWVGRNIASPSSVFFDKPVIHAENIEVGDIYTQSNDPRQRYVETLLANRDKLTHFGELVSPLNVKFVVLAKEADYRTFDFLRNQTDLRIVYEGPTIVVFRNTHPTPRLYFTEELIRIPAVENIIDRVERDILVAVYLQDPDVNEILLPDNQFRITPITYSLDFLGRIRIASLEERSGYVILAESHGDGWILNGEEGIPNLGTTTAFRVGPNEGALTISLPRSNSIIMGSVISGLTLAFVFSMYFLDRVTLVPGKRKTPTEPSFRRNPNDSSKIKVVFITVFRYLHSNPAAVPVLGFISLILLAAILMSTYQTLAERFAEVGYYLLVFGVLILLVEKILDTRHGGDGN